MQLYTLASGSSGNCALLTGGAKLLVDAGISCRKITTRLAQTGVHPRELDGILITHTHADHIGGLRVLLRRSPLPVYASEAAGEDLLRRVPDKIIEIFADHVEVFPGNYDYYMEKMAEKERLAAIQASAAPAPEKKPSAGAASYQKGKEARAAAAKARARVKALEKRLEELEAEIAEVEAQMTDPGLGYEALQELCAKLEELHKEQDADMEEWVELSE